MKVSTNVKSGNMLEDAFQAASNVGKRVSSFFLAADQQASGVTSAISNSMNKVWQSLADSVGQR
jgi:hypothetical protein